MEPITIDFNGYTITSDKGLMQLHDVHRWLSEEAYWCIGIPFETVKTAFENSYCIGALINGRQVAYGRLVTDYVVFGYLGDVYVAQEHRGKGISKKMMEILFGLDWVKGLRGIKLATQDAQGLYSQFGFTECKHPERVMEIARPDIYKPLNPSR
jgi:GNAT superfamily N-acetyltransferase